MVAVQGEGSAELQFRVETDWGAPVTAFGRVSVQAGDRVAVAVRPEGVRLAPRPERKTKDPDPWAGVVETVQFLGDAIEYRLKVREQRAARPLRPQHAVQGRRAGADRVARPGLYGRRRLTLLSGAYPFRKTGAHFSGTCATE